MSLDVLRLSSTSDLVCELLSYIGYHLEPIQTVYLTLQCSPSVSKALLCSDVPLPLYHAVKTVATSFKCLRLKVGHNVMDSHNAMLLMLFCLSGTFPVFQCLI